MLEYKEANYMTKQLTDKTAIVTGASSGIGTAIAKELIKAGANVVLAARSKDKLESIASEIDKEEKILCVPTDVTKQPEVDFLTERARQVSQTVFPATYNVFSSGCLKTTPHTKPATFNRHPLSKVFCLSAKRATLSFTIFKRK